MPTIIKQYKVELLISVGFLILFSILLAVYPAVRVGDGSNYYALFLAWKTNLKPYMTPDSWQAYRELEHSDQVEGLADTTYLQDIRQPLTLGETTDFSHFWLYSLLAFIVGLPFTLVNFPLSVHASFLLLHAILLSAAWIIAYRQFAWKGLVAVALLTLLSPIVWYFDKVHTELFTFCLTTSAVILFLRKRYLVSAFFLACAATQNISFAAISGLALLIGLYTNKKKTYSLGEVFLLTATVGLNVINPLYSFFRHGVLSPQQVHGYIELGSHLSHAYIWFFDPDIGLFPHWPVGFCILLASIPLFYGYLRKWREHIGLILLIIVYLSVSLAAQASTVNINAGGNPGVSRYALWYLALFFPLILFWVRKPMSKLWQKAVFSVVILAGFWFNWSHYHPAIDHFNYIRPSAFSFWVQKNFPALYDPPVEIFSERYGQRGENILNKGYLAVLGPDCRKLLLIDKTGEVVLGADGCNFEREKLSNAVRQKAQPYDDSQLPAYTSLTMEEFDASRNAAQMQTWYQFNYASPELEWLGAGWSYPEGWGIWMAEEKAMMRILCPTSPATSDTNLIIQLELRSLATQDHPSTEVSIYLDQNHRWSGKIPLQKRISVPYSPSVCQKDGYFDLYFEVYQLVSPLELGLSSDERSLGIGLIRLRFLTLQRKEP